LYEQFFHLTEKPFNLTPSPRFIYLGDVHQEALALLNYGVMERQGFILLTGEVGTGKTTVIQAFLKDLDKNVQYINLSNPALSKRDFINYIGFKVLGIRKPYYSKTQFLIELEDYLMELLLEDRHFILVIDEAHKLSFDVLEEVRLLSNLETPEAKLMNIFLVGQPELKEKLNQPKCRALLQRISIRYNIEPLKLEDTWKYITTRLKMAGADNENRIFTRNAIKAIHEHSKGYPRMINVIADNAMLLAYSQGINAVTTAMVEESYKDLHLD
jgi:general secretion pathway protein A